MHSRTIEHRNFVKRLLWYLCDIINEDLQIHHQSPLNLHALSDQIHHESPLILHSFQKQFGQVTMMIFLPQVLMWFILVEILYLGVQRSRKLSLDHQLRLSANTAAKLNWVCYLGVHFSCCPVIYCNDVGATMLCSNLVFHSRMKHGPRLFHWIRINSLNFNFMFVVDTFLGLLIHTALNEGFVISFWISYLFF